MIGLLIAILGVGGLLFAGEIIHRNHPNRIGPEFTRKFIHMSVGTFAAFWPLFISWAHIELLSLLLFVIVLLSHYFNIFHSIHSIVRKTWGDLFFAMSIGLVALFSQNEWFFTIAILHMALADGLAALVGTMFGTDNRYKVFGHYKSVAGTVTFYILSVLLIAIFAVFTGPHVSATTLLWLPLIATGLENVGVVGIDNLLVPVAIAILLQ